MENAITAELVENHIKEEEDEILPAVMAKLDAGSRINVGAMYSNFKMKFDALVQASAPARKKEIADKRIH